MSDVFTPQLVLNKAIDHCTAITGGGFPISLYPSKIQRIIREVNDCYGFPVDYVAAAMLVAVSVAIGNTHLARMKEGWDESAILYMALYGTIWHYMALYGTIWHYMALYGTIWH